MSTITHPLKEGQTVTAQHPSCPCRNAKMVHTHGTIRKVIKNQTGYWYYLDTNVTIKGEWITSVE